MKPLKLTLTAFGPYKDREVIDFEKLENNRLFVVSGKTGAGKTTIFDGISFALYGAASGEDRENDQMLRSDFADDDVHTSVELTFELHNETYRILRQLGHVKQGNKTATGDRYEFVKITSREEEPCVDRQIVSEINNRVEELVGLTKEQFRQIVMLPQGEFRKLLTSKTENKEEILRRIFKTQAYQKLNERLRDKKDQAQKDSEEELKMRDHYISEVSANLPERDDSTLFQVINQDHYNVNQVVAGLNDEQVYYQKHVQHLEQEKIKLSEQQEVMTTQYHHAKSIHEKDDERKKKQYQITELEGQSEEFNYKKESLAQAERASHIEPYEKQVKEVRTDVEQKQTHANQLQADQKKAKQFLNQAEITYQEEKDKESTREKVRDRLKQLEELHPKVQSLKKQEDQVLKLKDHMKQAEGTLKKTKQDLQQLTEEREEKQKKLHELETALQSFQTKNDQLSSEREKYRLFKKYLDYLKNQTQLLENLDNYKKDYQTKKHEYDRLEKEWIESQASILATHLHEGDACPVCGSVDHPDKQAATNKAPSKEEMNAARTKMDEVQRHHSRVEGQLQTIQQETKQLEGQIGDLGESIENPEESFNKVYDAGVELKKEVDRLNEKQSQLDQLKSSIRSLEEQIKQVQIQKDNVERDYHKQYADFQTEERVYQDQLQSIPEEVRSLTYLEEEIRRTKSELQQLEKSFEDAQKSLEQAREYYTAVETNCKNAMAFLDELKAKKKRYEQSFYEELKNNSFTDEFSYQQSKKAESERQALKQEIEQYEQSFQVLTERVKELDQELEGQEKADLEELKKQLDAIKTKYEDVLNQYNLNGRRLEDIVNLRNQIEQSHAQAAEKEKKLNQIAELYDLLRGQNEQKLSFERYLQIEYLEQIIEAANERLRLLSNGQFYLVRSNRQEARGRQSGLGLDVFDAYTGQSRDVKTLSGGEKFNASLCLALGMSDVIQSFQGGVSIETMFIDEGFGSLDDESLNKAIDTLVDLQKSGRMIGVISHVQELKTAIPAILEVNKTKDGHSETEFIIA
ncbi:AAA family ATPase [Alkalibacillus silvisoli]|uniref:Nuclease SbcCD subunit C n=1 Tax=Alkalibacillus silvisoli TaxID=392823 RepID=A0ABP3JHK0_9BACI